MPRPAKEPDKSTYSKRVGARVRKFRVEKGWSVEELWLKLRQAGLDVSIATINSWEAGRRIVHPDDYPTVARVFGVKLFEFLPPR